MRFTKIPSSTMTRRRNIMLHEEEDPATTASVELKASPVDEHLQRKRKVHFQEGNNVTYENHIQCKEDVRSQWYSVHDLAKFRREARIQILALRAEERLCNDPDSWAKSLLQAYQAFCAANTARDLEILMPQAPLFSLSTNTVGMERRAIHAIASDATARRDQIRSLIFHWQNAPVYNEDLRSEMMRETSCVISRPCRLYARNIALISADADL